MATYVRMQLRHCLCVCVLVSLFDRLTALIVCLFLVFLFCSFWLRDWASKISSPTESCRYLKSVVSNLWLNRYVRWLCGEENRHSLHYFVSSDGAGAFGAGAGAGDGAGAFGAGGAGFGVGLSLSAVGGKNSQWFAGTPPSYGNTSTSPAFKSRVFVRSGNFRVSFPTELPPLWFFPAANGIS